METKLNSLALIQAKVKAPKGQFNSFGKYAYRSAEDILESVKQVVNPMGFSISISDTIIMVGDRFYVQAIATLTDGKETYTSTAFAREEESKKGMDGSQVTGASSSYARKYALNGLFALDDTKDSDATNTHGKEQQLEAKTDWAKMINDCNTLKELSDLFIKHETSMSGNQNILNLLTTRKLQISK
jgi:hypothetical protein